MNRQRKRSRGPGRPGLPGGSVAVLVRLPADTAHAVNAEAERRGITRAELIRELLLPGLLDLLAPTKGDPRP